MTIKQRDAVKAYQALKKLNSQETSGSIALKIFNTMNKLQSMFDFQIQEERKILEKHPQFNPVEGKIKIENGDQEAAIAELKAIDDEFGKLASIENDVDIESFVINTNAESIKISGDDIKALDGIVEFT